MCVILKYLPETHQHELRIAWNAVDTLRNYRDIIQTRSFIVPTLCYTFAFSGLIAYFQISPLLLINGFGLTPMQYGYISIVIAASYLMGGLVVTRLVQIIGPKPMIKAGLLTSVAGGVCLILFSLLKLDALTIILFSVSIYVVGARIVIANAISEAFSDTRERSGTASALIGTVQMLGAAMTSSILAQFSHPNSLLLASCLSILSLCGLFTYYRLAQQAVNISTEGSEILLSNPPQA